MDSSNLTPKAKKMIVLTPDQIAKLGLTSKLQKVIGPQLRQRSSLPATTTGSTKNVKDGKTTKTETRKSDRKSLPAKTDDTSSKDSLNDESLVVKPDELKAKMRNNLSKTLEGPMTRAKRATPKATPKKESKPRISKAKKAITENSDNSEEIPKIEKPKIKKTPRKNKIDANQPSITSFFATSTPKNSKFTIIQNESFHFNKDTIDNIMSETKIGNPDDTIKLSENILLGNTSPKYFGFIKSPRKSSDETEKYYYNKMIGRGGEIEDHNLDGIEDEKDLVKDPSRKVEENKEEGVIGRKNISEIMLGKENIVGEEIEGDSKGDSDFYGKSVEEKEIKDVGEEIVANVEDVISGETSKVEENPVQTLESDKLEKVANAEDAKLEEKIEDEHSDKNQVDSKPVDEIKKLEVAKTVSRRSRVKIAPKLTTKIVNEAKISNDEKKDEIIEQNAILEKQQSSLIDNLDKKEEKVVESVTNDSKTDVATPTSSSMTSRRSRIKAVVNLGRKSNASVKLNDELFEEKKIDEVKDVVDEKVEMNTEVPEKEQTVNEEGKKEVPIIPGRRSRIQGVINLGRKSIVNAESNKEQFEEVKKIDGAETNPEKEETVGEVEKEVPTISELTTKLVDSKNDNNSGIIEQNDIKDKQHSSLLDNLDRKEEKIVEVISNDVKTGGAISTSSGMTTRRSRIKAVVNIGRKSNVNIKLKEELLETKKKIDEVKDEKIEMNKEVPEKEQAANVEGKKEVTNVPGRRSRIRGVINLGRKSTVNLKPNKEQLEKAKKIDGAEKNPEKEETVGKVEKEVETISELTTKLVDGDSKNNKDAENSSEIIEQNEIMEKKLSSSIDNLDKKEEKIVEAISNDAKTDVAISTSSGITTRRSRIKAVVNVARKSNVSVKLNEELLKEEKKIDEVKKVVDEKVKMNNEVIEKEQAVNEEGNRDVTNVIGRRCRIQGVVNLGIKSTVNLEGNKEQLDVKKMDRAEKNTEKEERVSEVQKAVPAKSELTTKLVNDDSKNDNDEKKNSEIIDRDKIMEKQHSSLIDNLDKKIEKIVESISDDAKTDGEISAIFGGPNGQSMNEAVVNIDGKCYVNIKPNIEGEEKKIGAVKDVADEKIEKNTEVSEKEETINEEGKKEVLMVPDKGSTIQGFINLGRKSNLHLEHNEELLEEEEKKKVDVAETEKEETFSEVEKELPTISALTTKLVDVDSKKDNDEQNNSEVKEQNEVTERQHLIDNLDKKEEAIVGSISDVANTDGISATSCGPNRRSSIQAEIDGKSNVNIKQNKELLEREEKNLDAVKDVVDEKVKANTEKVFEKVDKEEQTGKVEKEVLILSGGIQDVVNVGIKSNANVTESSEVLDEKVDDVVGTEVEKIEAVSTKASVRHGRIDSVVKVPERSTIGKVVSEDEFDVTNISSRENIEERSVVNLENDGNVGKVLDELKESEKEKLVSSLEVLDVESEPNILVEIEKDVDEVKIEIKDEPARLDENCLVQHERMEEVVKVLQNSIEFTQKVVEEFSVEESEVDKKPLDKDKNVGDLKLNGTKIIEDAILEIPEESIMLQENIPMLIIQSDPKIIIEVDEAVVVKSEIVPKICLDEEKEEGDLIIDETKIEETFYNDIVLETKVDSFQEKPVVEEISYGYPNLMECENKHVPPCVVEPNYLENKDIEEQDNAEMTKQSISTNIFVPEEKSEEKQVSESAGRNAEQENCRISTESKPQEEKSVSIHVPVYNNDVSDKVDDVGTKFQDTQKNISIIDQINEVLGINSDGHVGRENREKSIEGLKEISEGTTEIVSVCKVDLPQESIELEDDMEIEDLGVCSVIVENELDVTNLKENSNEKVEEKEKDLEVCSVIVENELDVTNLKENGNEKVEEKESDELEEKNKDSRKEKVEDKRDGLNAESNRVTCLSSRGSRRICLKRTSIADGRNTEKKDVEEREVIKENINEDAKTFKSKRISLKRTSDAEGLKHYRKDFSICEVVKEDKDNEIMKKQIDGSNLDSKRRCNEICDKNEEKREEFVTICEIDLTLDDSDTDNIKSEDVIFVDNECKKDSGKLLETVAASSINKRNKRKSLVDDDLKTNVEKLSTSRRGRSLKVESAKAPSSYEEKSVEKNISIGRPRRSMRGISAPISHSTPVSKTRQSKNSAKKLERNVNSEKDTFVMEIKNEIKEEEIDVPDIIDLRHLENHSGILNEEKTINDEIFKEEEIISIIDDGEIINESASEKNTKKRGRKGKAELEVEKLVGCKRRGSPLEENLPKRTKKVDYISLNGGNVKEKTVRRKRKLSPAEEPESKKRNVRGSLGGDEDCTKTARGEISVALSVEEDEEYLTKSTSKDDSSSKKDGSKEGKSVSRKRKRSPADKSVSKGNEEDELLQYSQGAQTRVIIEQLVEDLKRNIDENSKEWKGTTRKIEVKGIVICIVCNKEVKVKEWHNHKYRYHNNLAWRVGEKPLDLSTENVKSILNILYKQKKPLYCNVCDDPKKSIFGFLCHYVTCGKSEGELDAHKVECKICGHLIYKFIYLEHFKNHNKKVGVVEVCETETPEVVATPNRSRKAATKANNLIKNVSSQICIDDDEDEMKKFYTKGKLKKSDLERIFAPEKNKEIKCIYAKCKEKFGSVNEIFEHLKKCSKKGKEKCICKLCAAGFENVSNILKHLNAKHADDLQENYNLSGDEESEEEDDEGEPEVEEKPAAKRPSKISTYFNEKWKVYDLKFCSKVNFAVKELSPNINSSNYMRNLAFCEKNFIKDVFENFPFLQSNFAAVEPMQILHYLPKEKLSMNVGFQSITSANTKYQGDFRKFKLFETAYHSNRITTYCGGPITAMAWAPTPYTSQTHQQILAVSVLADQESNYSYTRKSCDKSVIQFWNYGVLHNNRGEAEAKFEFCLAHNFGPISSMEWCPSGCNDEQRLGLLAVCGSDGNVYGFAIGQPGKIKGKVVKGKPSFKLVLDSWTDIDLGGEECFATRVSWTKAAGHNFISVGYSNGIVAIFNLATEHEILTKNEDDVTIFYPYIKFQAHLRSITGITLHFLNGGKRWLATGSSDRESKFWDLDDFNSPIWVSKRLYIKQFMWMQNWLSTIDAHDDFANAGVHSTTIVHLKDFGSTHCTTLLYSSAPVGAIGISEWGNIVIQGNDVGEITGCLNKHYIPFISDLLHKKFFCGTIKVVPNGENKEKDKQNLYKERTYQGASNMFNMVFSDYPLKNFASVIKHGQAATSSAQGNYTEFRANKFPIESISSLAINPNRFSFLYNAIGYQSGFLRVFRSDFLQKNNTK